jgi:NAD(P)H dehydrogenase (quinone)
MNILIIVANPDGHSFNHALSDVAVKTLTSLEHQVVFHDLYAEKFDPVLKPAEIAPNGKIEATIKKHCKELASADGIIIVHPNWWGQPPAILKGWVDRVMRPGVAYRFKEGVGGEGIPVGLLKATKALVFNTANTKQERELTHFGDPLETLWKTCIFDLCGVKNFQRKTFSPVIVSAEAQRTVWLKEAKEIVQKEFPKI